MEMTIGRLKELISDMPNNAVCVIVTPDHSYLPAEVELEKAAVTIQNGSKSYYEFADGYDEYDMIAPVLVFR